jgi:hypothetical protein
MNEYLQYFLDNLVYNMIDAVVLAVSLVIFLKIVSVFTPLKNLKKMGENPVALAVFGSVILLVFIWFLTAGIIGY